MLHFENIENVIHRGPHHLGGITGTSFIMQSLIACVKILIYDLTTYLYWGKSSLLRYSVYIHMIFNQHIPSFFIL